MRRKTYSANEAYEVITNAMKSKGAEEERNRILELVEAELSCTCGTPFSHLLDKIKEPA